MDFSPHDHDGEKEEGEVTHVIPLGDICEHEESEDCVCGPEVDRCGTLVVHHALDGRGELDVAYTGARRSATLRWCLLGLLVGLLVGFLAGLSRHP